MGHDLSSPAITAVVIGRVRYRYYAICRPLRARSVHTVRRTVCLVALFWVSSLVLLLPQLYIQRLDPLVVLQLDLVDGSSSQPPSAEFRLVHVCVEYFVDRRWNVVYTAVFYLALCVLPVPYSHAPLDRFYSKGSKQVAFYSL